MAEAPAAPEPAPADAATLPAADAAPAPDAVAELDAATPAENAVPVEVAPAPTMPKLTDSAPDLPAGEVAAAVLGDLPMAEPPQPGTTTTIAVLPSDMSDSEAVPETADGPPPPPLTPEEEALLQPAPAPAAEPAPALIVPDEPPVAGQGSLAPDPGLPMAGTEAETGRLPQIGTEPAAPDEAAPPAEPATDTRPLVQFARPFTRELGKPLFSILMVDPGGPDVDRTTLAALPFPVTFVIDPMAPDAATAEAIYRAAGQEVVMAATGIPEGATAADLEQTFQAHAAALPQSVAVIDLPEGGLGENRPLATLAVPVVEAQGRGLITYDVGLNAGDQVARRADMPAATIFRRLDAEGESKPVMRRYLDRAAFKAAQDGQVMVIGSTRPETVAAILEWTVEGRATTVSLAPASAVLLAQ
ncbi:divergent polysaccharide deacetylase family protein [Neotabrizicola shimadae]|uniref:Divergent polysaccharide deacetylase family protein n=2 Tax=Neotabrizicola shimadae TaxID=2807096 RepID=A0A8G1EEY3_9RHOB|nr:divergent polysaccharide deacetylase family protein [Neotabrizicola shimadae]